MNRRFRYYIAFVLMAGLIAGNISAGLSVKVLAAESQGALMPEALKDMDKSMEKEIRELLNAYYTARAEGDANVLKDLKETTEDLEIDMYKIMREEGVKEYRIEDFKFYPLEENQTEGIVSVFYNMLIQGIDTQVPGMEGLYIYKQDGEWKIKTDYGNDIFYRIQESEEFVRDAESVEAKYEQTMGQDKEVAQWMEKLEKKLKDLSNDYAKQQKEGTDKTDTGKKNYVVKKGDCLWSIAEEQLKDAEAWLSIYHKNRDIIGSRPEVILPGQELVMPQ